MNERITKTFVLSFAILALITAAGCNSFKRAGIEQFQVSDEMRVVVFECDATEEEYESMMTAYQKIPSEVIDGMSKHGIYVFYTETENAEERIERFGGAKRAWQYVYPHTVSTKNGVKIAEQAKIMIFPGGQNAGYTLMHEMGHMIFDTHSLDCIYNASIECEQADLLFEQYKESVGAFDKSSHINVYCKEEFFAESFRIYVLDELWLRNVSEDLADFISNRIEEFYKKEC